MKRILSLLFGLIIMVTYLSAQNNYYPLSGGVGIGTTNPDGKLNIFGTSGEVKLHLGNSDPAGYTAIRFGDAENGWGQTAIHRFNANYSHSTATTYEPNSVLFYEGVGSMNLGSATNFKIYTGGVSEGNERIRVTPSGNVGIGTTTPQTKLAVNGTISSTEVKVKADISTIPDYVFEPDYQLRSLEETEEYIKANKHLPEIPSAAEISEEGLTLGEMNLLLLKKIEEMTLYQIELIRELNKLKMKLNDK